MGVFQKKVLPGDTLPVCASTSKMATWGVARRALYTCRGPWGATRAVGPGLRLRGETCFRRVSPMLDRKRHAFDPQVRST